MLTILPFPSNRNSQETNPTSVQSSIGDSNIKNNMPQNKNRNKITVKKQQQLKKLEELANKYSERNQKYKGELKNNTRKSVDKSQIPIPKKTMFTQQQEPECDTNSVLEKVAKDEMKVDKTKINVIKTSRKPLKEKKVIEIKVNKKEIKKYETRNDTKLKLMKETSMSLDSLEDSQPITDIDKNRQSIGINTEFVCPCVPCVIYDNTDPKPRKSKNTNKIVSQTETDAQKLEEPKVQLLYQNLTMVSSCDIGAKHKNEENVSRQGDDDIIINNFENTSNTESISNVLGNKSESSKGVNVIRSDYDVNSLENKLSEGVPDLLTEHIEENYEHDISNDYCNEDHNKYEDYDGNNEVQDILCRHGSGDTYTKFSDNSANLEEFINMTDKMMSSHYAEDKFLEKEVETLHTPRTNSLDAIKDTSSENNNPLLLEPSKPSFSDTLEILKTDLKVLMEGAGGDVIITPQEPNKGEIPKPNTNVCDMEHITVYQLNVFEEKKAKENPLKNVSSEFKLPSISETNRPHRKVSCNKLRMQKLYKPHKKYTMLGEQNRANTEYQTFIVKDNADDNSDGHSITSEAPPLKLPRIENKRLGYDNPFPKFHFIP
ncbi:unnamed protein product [Diatraea saccharalis]|uniref:Uncharacterized protein n=1 Tax=Diatraea saccharalis TaxID=40085 RepID=A0A9N9WC85_9NEOP|nr:unnamed protein product [Diatraea saccharalis]